MTNISAQSVTASSPEQLLFSDTPDGFLQWILDPDTDIDSVGDDGVTPLTILAIEQRHTMGLAVLLEHGADLVQHVQLIKERNLEGLALLLLVQLGQVEVFNNLLQQGIDPNLTVKMGPLPVPNFILKRVDQKVLETPMLHLVVENPDVAFVDALLDAKADINALDSEGNTALHVGAVKPVMSEEGDFLNIEALLKRGADKTIKNRQGYTPAEYINVFFNAVNPEALNHPAIRKLVEMLTPEGKSSSIILLS